MFGKEPWLFETYHQGFRRQTLKWPVNPVDVILKFLNKHPKWKIADLGARGPARPRPAEPCLLCAGRYLPLCREACRRRAARGPRTCRTWRAWLGAERRAAVAPRPVWLAAEASLAPRHACAARMGA